MRRPAPIFRALVFALVFGVGLAGALSFIPGVLKLPATLLCPSDTAEVGYEESRNGTSRGGGVDVTISCLDKAGTVIATRGALPLFLALAGGAFLLLLVPAYAYQRRSDAQDERRREEVLAKRGK